LFLVRADAIVGNRAAARRLSELLKERAARGEVSLTCVGWAYAAIGERDKAFDYLNRAFDAREPLLRNHLHSPILKDLQGDPRYSELLLRMQRGFDD